MICTPILNGRTQTNLVQVSDDIVLTVVQFASPVRQIQELTGRGVELGDEIPSRDVVQTSLPFFFSLFFFQDVWEELSLRNQYSTISSVWANKISGRFYTVLNGDGFERNFNFATNHTRRHTWENKPNLGGRFP